MKFKKALICIMLALALAIGTCAGAFAASVKMGDVDFDGLVTAEDALLVLRATAGTSALTEAQQSVADVTYDGKINSVDALRILLFVSGNISTLDKLSGEEGDDLII